MSRNSNGGITIGYWKTTITSNGELNERANQESNHGCIRGHFSSCVHVHMGNWAGNSVNFPSDINTLERVQLLLIDLGGVLDDTAAPETA